MSCSVSPTTTIRFGSDGTVVVPNSCSTFAGNAASPFAAGLACGLPDSSSEPHPAASASSAASTGSHV